MKILITGITGFVGVNIVKYLGSLKKFTIYGLDIKNPAMRFVEKIYSWDELDIIPDVDAIIHLAGKAHFTSNIKDESEYFEINFGLSKIIFDFFLVSSASQFHFMSSVAAMSTKIDEILNEEMEARPTTPYGKSKRMAEEYILSNSITSDKFVYIYRPCMMYGPENKGNLNLLFNIVSKGIPWPLGAFSNKRSFFSVENMGLVLYEFLKNKYPSGIYQLADDEPISTNEIIKIMADVLDKKIRIINIPKKLVYLIARTGNFLKLPLTTERLEKLTESFVVSNEKVKKTIKTSFPIKTVDGIRKTIETFN